MSETEAGELIVSVRPSVSSPQWRTAVVTCEEMAWLSEVAGRYAAESVK